MKRRLRISPWASAFQRGLAAYTRNAVRSAAGSVGPAQRLLRARRTPAPRGAGSWLPGIALGAAGARRYRLFRPPGLRVGERVPLMVMLHGCGQDANSFAASTRMNSIARRERFLVLYPEQDRLANAQACWNWFDTAGGRALGEAALIMAAIDQVCLLQPVDRTRVAIAGMSAGASMAALLATRHPARFRAVIMHSGVPPGAAHSGLSAMAAMRGHRPALARTPALPGHAATWPPLLVIHGAADTVVAPQNGQAAAQAWTAAAGARPGTPRRVQRGGRYPMHLVDFTHGGGTVVTLVAVEQLAHAWSGGAAGQPHGDPRGPDASRMAWAFAARQFGA